MVILDSTQRCRTRRLHELKRKRTAPDAGRESDAAKAARVCVKQEKKSMQRALKGRMEGNASWLALHTAAPDSPVSAIGCLVQPTADQTTYARLISL